MCSLWHRAGPCMTELPLGSEAPELGKLSSGTSMTAGCFSAMLYWNLPKEGATLGLLLPKQGKLWCFWQEHQLI